MGKKPTPEQVKWQKAARERLVLVLERLFDGNQSRLARALGVTQALVNIVVRKVQPPTRNLMTRLGGVERVNRLWAETGEGEPLLPDVRCTLPVSDVLLPGPLADNTALMTGERVAVASAYDRPTCYFWRLSSDHPAVAVARWRLTPGDLLLLETEGAVVSDTEEITGKKVVIDGKRLGRIEPVYGEITRDEKSRLVFGDDKPRLRFDRDPSPPGLIKKVIQGSKRTIRLYEADPAKDTDPWYALPHFDEGDVLAVQLLLVRF
jgi:hypothetical protein